MLSERIEGPRGIRFLEGRHGFPRSDALVGFEGESWIRFSP